MKIQFLGTSAAHSTPLPFCNCKMCTISRKFAGKNLRRRSSALINENLIIDLGPDFMSSSFSLGVDTSKILYWLQTHSHSDHFNAGHLIIRIPEYGAENVKPLSLIASSLCIQNISKKIGMEEYGANLYDDKWLNKLKININSISNFELFKFGAYSLVGFNANHDDNDGASIYYLSDGTCNLFYGLDTNGITEETFAYLEDKKIFLNIVILDHTYGYNIRASDHLNGNQFIETVKEFKNRKIINDNTKIYASHISHEGNLPHEEFEILANKNGYNVAYDGLTLSINP